MNWTVTPLDLGEVELNPRRLDRRIPMTAGRARAGAELAAAGGQRRRGDRHRISPCRHPEAARRSRAAASRRPSSGSRASLALHGVKPADVRYVLHTHLHIDHAGQTDIFPMATTAVVNRRELEYAVSGLSGPSYPPEDIKHMIDRLHTRGALRLLDLELTGGEEVDRTAFVARRRARTPKARCSSTSTRADGLACFCGDLVYSVRHQLLTPTTTRRRSRSHRPTTSSPRRAEKAAMKRMLQSAPRFTALSEPRPLGGHRSRQAWCRTSCGEGAGSGGCWCRLLEGGSPADARSPPTIITRRTPPRTERKRR